ncbi:hypothetical protein C5167_001363 [Papaver somniferum]|uniref:Protein DETOXIFICATION n=2 Tax=Papaver somniferum TaxID=3469 RepID=A0A4Y7KWK4_PAPSO|nr:hypothetical protein C5167_001363 [Papaver somniferum]
MGMGSALETLCGQSYGAKQYHMLGIHMQRGMFVLLLVSVPLAFIWANTGRILIAVGQDPEISAEAGVYARYMIPCLFAYGLLQCHISLELWSFELTVLLSGFLPNPKLETSVLSICLNTCALLWMIPTGFGGAVSTRVSNELGAGHPQAARLAVQVVFVLAVTEGLLIGTIMILVRHIWGNAFSNEKEVVNYVASMLPILAVSNFFDGLQSALSGAARGCGWQDIGAFVNLGSYYLVGIPSAVLLAFVLHVGGKLQLGFSGNIELLRSSLQIHKNPSFPFVSLDFNSSSTVFFLVSMDPNPKTYPILSYTMNLLPSLGKKHPSYSDFDDIDIEQQAGQSNSSASPSKTAAAGTGGSKLESSINREVELMEVMPHLKDPEVLSAMTSAVSDVSQTRSILKALGERPDHESVDSAKSKISEIESNLYDQIQEIEADSRLPNAVELEREMGIEAEKEKKIYEAVIKSDEMHESYETLLKNAEERLLKIYRLASSRDRKGKGVAEEERMVDKEMNEEVVRILQEGLSKGIERVVLCDRELRYLPEEFGKIRGLVSLDLSTNQLQVIPDSISGLEKLEELNLSSNILESLPDSIGLLVNLKYLNVSTNELKTFPGSIIRCRSLVELDASYNQLTYLPTKIGELVNLQKLLVGFNKIRSLPSSICEMKSLRHLDAHFNELHGLPHTIGFLTSLEILNVSSNFSDFRELPVTFGELMNLKEVDISNNQISALPDTFGRLDSLTKLNLDQNPLFIPPAEIVKQGVDAVKEFMAKRWVDILLEEERKSMEAHTQAQKGWLTRSTSWLTGYLVGGEKSPKAQVHYLDQDL